MFYEQLETADTLLLVIVALLDQRYENGWRGPSTTAIRRLEAGG